MTHWVSDVDSFQTEQSVSMMTRADRQGKKLLAVLQLGQKTKAGWEEYFKKSVDF